jgi:hypothetical protein
VAGTTTSPGSRWRVRCRWPSRGRSTGAPAQRAPASQVRDLLANPALQIYPGTGMTCVFDPSKAKCRLTSQDDTRRTPDLTDCQPGCQNIARTDRDIEHVRQQASELADLVNDPLSPAPRHERERHELARLHAILNDHQATRPNPETTT